jgi:hypothetical protein
MLMSIKLVKFRVYDHCAEIPATPISGFTLPAFVAKEISRILRMINTTVSKLLGTAVCQLK